MAGIEQDVFCIMLGGIVQKYFRTYPLSSQLHFPWLLALLPGPELQQPPRLSSPLFPQVSGKTQIMIFTSLSISPKNSLCLPLLDTSASTTVYNTAYGGQGMPYITAKLISIHANLFLTKTLKLNQESQLKSANMFSQCR